MLQVTSEKSFTFERRHILQNPLVSQFFFQLMAFKQGNVLPSFLHPSSCENEPFVMSPMGPKPSFPRVSYLALPIPPPPATRYWLRPLRLHFFCPLPPNRWKVQQFTLQIEHVAVNRGLTRLLFSVGGTLRDKNKDVNPTGTMSPTTLRRLPDLKDASWTLIT